MGRLGEPVDRAEWAMPAHSVNAYYHPLLNEIVFPAGILQPPFFYADADDAVNYGAIGAVIGHEITHGFDDQGSHFDADGALRDWWTEADRAEFDRRAQVLVEQFDGYAVVDDLHVNGRLTLGENIADLGGLTIAYDALREALAGEATAPIDGLTPEQRFFLSWATVWRTNYTDEYLRLLVNVDPHSPARFRVNGPLSNLPAFAAAFAIADGVAHGARRGRARAHLVMKEPQQYDVVVVGSGPAGLSAAVNVANRRRTVAVFTGQSPLGRIGKAHAVSNYLGFTSATGEELAGAFVRHLEEFEVPLIREKVSKIIPDADGFVVFSEREVYRAGAVVLATGVYRDAEIEGEADLVGQGVSYCVTCDGRLFTGRRAAFVSYSANGEEEASALAEDYGVDVTYVALYEGDVRLPEGRARRRREQRRRAWSGRTDTCGCRCPARTCRSTRCSSTRRASRRARCSTAWPPTAATSASTGTWRPVCPACSRRATAPASPTRRPRRWVRARSRRSRRCA